MKYMNKPETKSGGSLKPVGSACLHENLDTIGATDWGIAHAVVEWCRRCGAWRMRMLNWEYKVGEWHLPNTERSHGEKTIYEANNGRRLTKTRSTPLADAIGSGLMIELLDRRSAMQRICDAVGTDDPERVPVCFRALEDEMFKQRKEIKRLNAIINGTPCPHCNGTGRIPNVPVSSGARTPT